MLMTFGKLLRHLRMGLVPGGMNQPGDLRVGTFSPNPWTSLEGGWAGDGVQPPRAPEFISDA